MRERLLRAKELAQLLNVAVGTIYNWQWRGRIKGQKFGRCLRFDYASVLRQLEERRG